MLLRTLGVASQQRQAAVEKIYETVHQANQQFFELWLTQTFLHWDWWASLLLAVVPWLIWWRVRIKESSSRLMHAGLFVMVVTAWLDSLGVAAGLWFYTGKLIPSIPAYVPFDFCLLPVLVMLVLQFKPGISYWIKGIGFALFCAFVAEPFFEWIGFYVRIRWLNVYSVPIYTAIYLVAHWLAHRRHFERLAS